MVPVWNFVMKISSVKNPIVYFSANNARAAVTLCFYMIVGIAKIVLVVPIYAIKAIVFGINNTLEKNILKNLKNQILATFII
jgi:hypothetical protein